MVIEAKNPFFVVSVFHAIKDCVLPKLVFSAESSQSAPSSMRCR